MPAFYPGSTYDRQQRVAQDSIFEQSRTGSILLYLDSRQLDALASDFSVGNWTTQSGSTTNLFAVLDETIPDNSDYIRSELDPSNSPVTLSFDTLSTPLSGVQYIRYNYGKDSLGSARIDLTVELLEGASVVQTWTHTDIPSGFTSATQQITNAISNYAILSVRFTGNQV